LGVLAVPSAACGALGAAGLDLLTARRALAELDAEALAAVGVEVAAVHAPAVAHRGRLAFTPGARAALHAWADEARRQGSRRPGPEHLVLVLAAGRAPDVAAAVLARSGVDEAELRGRLAAP